MEKTYIITESELQALLKCGSGFKLAFYNYLNTASDLNARDRFIMESAANWAVRNILSYLKEAPKDHENNS
jgi:hypothetical protein